MSAAGLPVESLPPRPLSADRRTEGRIVRRGLAAIGLLLILTRVPVMYLQPGGQDEDVYAVPGLMILENGVPRLPHIPARNAESVFYRADEAMFCEPPGYFYFQAPFYALLPDVYGTGRLASGVAGFALLCLLCAAARAAGIGPVAALWGVGLFSVSRWFYFSIVAARPDVLCSAFGVAAILAVFHWRSSGRTRWLVGAGLAIGLGGLSHPFALVYAIQVAGWTSLAARGWRRLGLPLLVAAVALLTASTWLILIVQYPEPFKVQFSNQFLHDTGGSLFERLFWPWESLDYHLGMEWDHIGPWQVALATGGWLACLWRGGDGRQPGIACLGWLIGSSLWLMSALVGPHHPVHGYWSYPAALAFAGLGLLIEPLVARRRITGVGGTADRDSLAAVASPGSESAPVTHRPFRGHALGWGVGLVIAASMVPGSGVRALVVYVGNWGDIHYDAPRFARSVMAEIPPEAVCAVDTQFAMDFLAAGRPTLLAQTLPVYFRLEQHPHDYLVVSRHGIETGIAQRMNARLLWTRGNREDLFACYVEVYAAEPSSRPPANAGR